MALDKVIDIHGEATVKASKITKDKIQDFITKRRKQLSASKNLPEINSNNKNEYIFSQLFDADIMVLDRHFSCEIHENNYLLFMNTKNSDCSDLKFINWDATFLFGRQGIYRQLLYMVVETNSGERLGSLPLNF